MYTQLIAALALTGSANALVAKPRQAACSQLPSNITTTFQRAQTQINILERAVVQNSTAKANAAAADNLDDALDAVFLSLSSDKDELKVCNFTPKQSPTHAADTWTNRNIATQLLQQLSSKLQTVQQAVVECDHTGALHYFCNLEAFWINGEGADLAGVTTTSAGSSVSTNGTSATGPSKGATAPTNNNGGDNGNGGKPFPAAPSPSATSSPSTGSEAHVSGGSCDKFPSNTTAMIQKVETDANTVIANIAQNATKAVSVPGVVAFTTSFNNLFDAVSGGHGTLQTVCNVTVPTLEQEQAAAKASGIQPTQQLRESTEQSTQSGILLPLQKIAQDVVNCDQPSALADYCKIAKFFYGA